SRGHEVEAPELPNTNNPKESEQVDFVLKNCKFDEHTVIIGHSLGAMVAMKLLMKLNKPISGVVMVSPASIPGFTGTEKRPFWENFDWNFDYDQIHNLTGGKILVLSDTRQKKRMTFLK